ncbi:MAG: hypothetical protein Q9221_001702 [Calogaya cf. arnoldii]
MPLPSIYLILDFDGTLTTASTLPLIYDIGHRLNPSCPSWQSISQAYIDDYRDLKSAQIIKPSTLLQELSWLESLRAIEHRSIARVEATKVFRGVTKEIIHSAADKAVRDREIELRPGWEKLVGKVMEGHGKVGVVSVGWSADFIKGCMEASVQRVAAAGQDGNLEKGVDVASIDVRANNVLGGDEGKMDRYWKGASVDDRSRILTAADKLRVMTDVVDTEHIDGSRPLVVYVGDSTTDLECFLHADVGICFGGEPATMTGEQRDLEETLNRVGIDRRWLGDMKEADLEVALMQSINRPLLWWAKDFDEIRGSPLLNPRNYCKDREKNGSSDNNK